MNMHPLVRIVRRSFPAVIASASLASSPAWADLDYTTAPAPGGFVQSGAGPTTASFLWPGADFFGYFPSSASDLDEQAFVGGGEAQAAAAYADASITNGASGAARLGVMQGEATNSTPNNQPFPAAAANGGWSDMIEVTSPGLDGEAGFLVFTLNAGGTLFASGFAGTARFVTTAYKDDAQLLTNPLFDPGDSDPLSSAFQYGNWAVATYGNPPTASKTVNDTVTFAVPITFGEPFRLGVYATATAGLRSVSGVGGLSTGDADFFPGLSWGGVAAVYHNDAPLAQFTVNGASGVDWTNPVTPLAPGDFDGDGDVDAADLATLLGAWGGPDGDLDGDNDTDAADLAILLSNWG